MNVLGLIAGALTTLSFLPQVVRTLRTRSASDLSWPWLVAFSAGTVGWLIYGVWSGSPPVTAANAITFALVGMLVGLKAWHGASGRSTRLTRQRS
jgi:MtN3 and saliva related transmembrane protein